MVKDLIGLVIDRITNHVGVHIIFGETREFQNKAIIPVSKVMYGFGSGGGAGGHIEQDVYQGEGGGAGGGVKASPIGVFEVSETGTRFIPALHPLDILKAILAFVVVFKLRKKPKLS